MEAPRPILLRGDGKAASQDPQHTSSLGIEDTKEPILACADCDHPITRHAWAHQQGGKQRHTFLNPAGFVFHIGCFSEAPGVRATGQRSNEFTWFEGYTWQIVVCGACGTQLGWCFERAAQAFFGLVLVRLRERSAPQTGQA